MITSVRRLVLSVAVLIILAAASSARADSLLNYQITGPGSAGTFTADFALFMHPTPSGGNSLAFWFSNLPVDVNGSWTDLDIAFGSLQGGIVAGSGTFALFGSQLYSWPSSSSTPIMNTGIFTTSGITASGLGTYQVTVTSAMATPEPASLAL